MCQHYVKVESSSPCGVTSAYVPCGKCVDCRRQIKEAWLYRLYSEFLTLRKKGWNVGFITLTYDPDSLPLIPEECFVDKSQYKEIPCFDRVTVRDWINNIRQYCKYHYKFVNGRNLRYFVASEYGSVTHRPHYHAILAWPPTCSYEEMHALCKHFWTKGLVGPKEPQGDSHCCSFEVKGDASAVLSYVAEYVAKDIDFVDALEGIEMYSNVRKYEELTDERAYAQMFRNCVPFHMQSVSLGMAAVEALSDEEKCRLLQDGTTFNADGHVVKCPIYVKNKLLFDNYYIVDENGKRLVRRKASEFFEKYHCEIFEKKAAWYDEHLRSMSAILLSESGVDTKVVEYADKYLTEYRSRIAYVLEQPGLMGKLYLAYSRVPDQGCYDIPLEEQWMLRYRHPDVAVDEDWPKADLYFLSWLTPYWDFVDLCYGLINSVHLQDRENEARLKKKILSFYNNL